ncbi:MAG TPA: hypothetical protein VK203_17845, partial [Nostocaceae cyanobacterium]|nr:hypothetical protein [Nostocaceae cyanobacterium]
GRWGDGEMGRWGEEERGDGEMGRWGEEERGESFCLSFSASPRPRVPVSLSSASPRLFPLLFPNF